jgi:hypothetical protein
MPAKITHYFDKQNSICSRDIPLHLRTGSGPKLADHNINEELVEVEGPLKNVPKNVEIINFEMEELPRLFTTCHCIKFDANLQIMKALKLGYNYLWRPALRQQNKLTCSMKRQEKNLR